MLLRRWDPLYELRRWNLLHRDMDRLEGVSYTTLEDNPEVESWPIPLNVVHEDDEIVVHASMPEVDPENIEVLLDENVLTIKGNTKTEQERKEGGYLIRERRSGSFHRVLRLPDTVDIEKAESH